MARWSVDQVLDALINSEDFRKSFRDDRVKTLKSLGLGAKERKAFAELDVDALLKGGTSVRDQFLRRFCV